MTESNPDDFLSPADFDKIEINISLENLTASTGVVNDHRIYGDLALENSRNSLGICLMEFLDNGLALDVPAKTASMGHNVRLEFDVTGVHLPFTFEAKGQITEVHPLDEGREKFVVQFFEYDSRYMSALVNLFSDRQRQIEEFLFQTKG